MTDISSPDPERGSEPVQDQPSDARVILGPLVKYAAIGLVIVIIIVGTAITLDRELNTIDEEVAALQAQLAGTDAGEAADTAAKPDQSDVTAAGTESVAVPARTAERVAVPQQPETPVSAVAPEPNDPAADEIARVAEATPAAQAVEPAVETETEATGSVPADAPAPVSSSTNYGPFEWPSMDPFIAERNAYLRERDRMYRDGYQASREKQLQLMRERAARQQSKIEEMERRYQELYDIRETDMRESQETQDSFLPDRI